MSVTTDPNTSARNPTGDWRNKWEQCTDAEKIERLRNELQQAYGLINVMREEMTRLGAHQHLDGKLVIPINHERQSAAVAGRMSSLT